MTQAAAAPTRIGYNRRLAAQLHNLLVNRILEARLAAVAETSASGRLIDVGCGTKPYEGMFGAHVNEHVGLDLPDGRHGQRAVDLRGTAYEIPAEDESFDTVLCTAVLEHLEEPHRALNEAFRVLRPGGVAIYSAPLFWHLHEEPRDFYRYTKYGLGHLFGEAGFAVERIEALSGFWVTMGQMSVYYLMRFNRGPLRLFPILPALGLLIQGGAWLLDRLDRAEAWTWMYLVVARRPAARV